MVPPRAPGPAAPAARPLASDRRRRVVLPGRGPDRGGRVALGAGRVDGPVRRPPGRISSGAGTDRASTRDAAIRRSVLVRTRGVVLAAQRHGPGDRAPDPGGGSWGEWRPRSSRGARPDAEP